MNPCITCGLLTPSLRCGFCIDELNRIDAGRPACHPIPANTGRPGRVVILHTERDADRERELLDRGRRLIREAQRLSTRYQPR